MSTIKSIQNCIKEEWRIFFTALMFYTRIPCPKNDDYVANTLNKASRYFPLIGWIVGFISFIAFCVALYLFNVSIAALLSLLAGVLVTGAFHEDGLADTFDGFGGGWTKLKILDIMKDSRIGAYGVIALSFLLFLKYLALVAVIDCIFDDYGTKQMSIQAYSHNHTYYFNNFNNFNDFNIFNSLNINLDIDRYLMVKRYSILLLLFISYHALSRLSAISLVFCSNYCKENEDSKAKPIADKHGYIELLGASFFGLLPVRFLCMLPWQFSLVLMPLIALVVSAKRYFERWINGYTGDCLGAVEQIAECFCLLSFLSIFKYI